MRTRVTEQETIQAVGQHLFSEEGVNVYSVLDGASIPDLLDKLYGMRPNFVCLQRGELEPDMAEVAPYLVRLDPDSEFADWVIGRGWGRHWGIFALSRADIRWMRRHLQSFLIVYDTEGTPLHFRYYDPRVMRTYLPTCNGEELASLFGPVTLYILEDEDPGSVLRFSVTSGSLKQEGVRLGGS
jgi:hypothetical protein